MKEYTPNKELFYEDLPDLVDIVGISFRTAGKIYYFASCGIVCKEGEHAIVETTRGAEYGIVSAANHLVPKSELILPLRSIIRVATPEDDKRFEQNAKKEEEAFDIALKKIADHKLEMKLVDVEYTFDNSKLLFYFTADDRVDFRELVKDLASVFRTRIELRQIGIRDEAKMMGGLGICGREFCCHSFLGDFAQVTIKMAKEQNLSLNASKISGTCGKLMCCLRFEHESYQQEIALTPKVDAQVTTPDGPGVVVSNDPLRGICNVRLNKTTDGTVTPYHRDLLNRPENPTCDVASPKPSERSKRDDEVHVPTPRVEKTPRHNPTSTDTPVKVPAPVSEENSESSDLRNNRPAHSNKNEHFKGDRNKKRSDVKSEGKPEAKIEPKAVNKSDQTAERKSQESNSKPKHPPKPHRPNTPEKKNESKFDAKFAGAPVNEDSKAEPKTEHRPHHRRPYRSDKKNDKKIQKTENNN